MRARQRMPDERPGVLRLSDPSIELTQLGFDEARPWPTAPASRREQDTDLSEREPRILAELDQCHALDARDAVLPSTAGPSGRGEQPDSLVIAERRAGQPATTSQFTNHDEPGLMWHTRPLT